MLTNYRRYDQPGASVMSSFGKGIHKYLNTRDNDVLFLFVQDPADHPSCTYNEEKNVSIWVPSGRIKVCLCL